MRRLASAICLTVLLFSTSAFGGDPLKDERKMMNDVLKTVAADVQKNFYDPNLHGIDWKAWTDETRQKIDSATTYNDMVAAVYEFVDKLHDSHTWFEPPASAVRVVYGFDAKPYADQIRVYSVEKHGPSERAGLLVGDVILRMGDYQLTRANYLNAFIYSRVLMPTNPLTLVVKRGSDVNVISITPDVQRTPPVIDCKYYNMCWGLFLEAQSFYLKQKKFQATTQGGIGYVTISSFPSDSGEFLVGWLDKVRDAKAIVIDLRECPGGQLGTMLSFAGAFESVDDELGKVSSRTKTTTLTIHPTKPRFGAPVVILVDSFTASAAEMFARHMQLKHGAKVVGDRTSGSVSGALFFQRRTGAPFVYDFGTQIAIDRLKLQPGDEELEGKGVNPDVICIPRPDEMQKGEDSCKDIAVNVAQNLLAERAKGAANTTSSSK